MLLGLGACSKDKVEQGSVRYEDAADDSRKLQETRVWCRDSKCHPAIGMLTWIEDDRAQACIGFLISSNQIATASRCLPPVVRSGLDTCDGRIVFAMPATGNFAAESRGCRRLVYASPSENQPAGPDYAILELSSEVARPPMEWNRSGIADGAPVTTYSLSYVNGPAIFGEIATLGCRAVQKSIALPSYDQDRSALVSISQCDGNDIGGPGSPVQDSAGRARGILRNLIEDTDTLNRQFVWYLESKSSKPIASATNLACIAGPQDSRFPAFIASECGAPEPQETLSAAIRRFTAESRKRALQAVDLAFHEWASQNSGIVRWKLVSRTGPHELNETITPEPECIQAPETWISKFRHRWFLGKGLLKKTNVRLQGFRVWELENRANTALQFDLKAQETPAQDAALVISPKKVHSTGQSQVILKLQGNDLPFAHAQLRVEKTLSLCK